MPGATLENTHMTLPRRRSLRIKRISKVYDEDSKHVNSCPQSNANGQTNSSILSHVKAEVPDLEEITSLLSSEFSTASVADNGVIAEHFSNKVHEDDEQNFQDISLKDIQARCKAKKRKPLEIVSEGAEFKNQSQSWNREDVKPKEEIDLEEPLIVLKLKRPKISCTKMDRMIDAEASPQHAERIEGAASNRDETPSARQAHSFVPIMAEELEKKITTNLGDYTIASDDQKGVGGEEICFIEEERTILSAGCIRPNSGNVDVFCEIKTEDVDICSYEELAKSTDFNSNSFGHSPAEMHLETTGNNCDGEKSCFMSQPYKVVDVSDNFLPPNNFVKFDSFDKIAVEGKSAYTVSPLDFIKKVNHQQTLLDDPTNSHMDKSSTGSEYLPCSLNKACDDHLEIDGYWSVGGVQGNVQKSIKAKHQRKPSDDLTSSDMDKSTESEYFPCSLNKACDDHLEIHGYWSVGGIQGNGGESIIRNHQQKPLDDLTNSNMDKSSTVNEYLLCSLNQACDHHLEADGYWSVGGVQGNVQEGVKTVEESSPTNERNSDMSSTVVNKSYLAGGTERKCASLEEARQMQAEDQLDSLVCHTAGEKEMLLHTDMEHAATDYTLVFNKTLDFCETANFVAEDGRLESIVYDALNSHGQVKTNKTKSSAGPPNTTGIQILLDQFPGNCSNGAKASSDGRTLLTEQAEWPSVVAQHLNANTNSDIPGSVHDGRLGEGFVLQTQSFQACISVDKGDGETSECARELPSSSSEETQELHDGAPTLTAGSQETRQIEESEPCTNEGSIEEHGPKKLLSKRKIMSPTSQEKLCQALTDIDLCDEVQRLKRKIILEDCDKTRRTLHQSANKQDISVIHTERAMQRLKSRNPLSPTSKGVSKSAESPSPRSIPCSCNTSSPIHLDTKKAVEFSQRQMHDIENIAARLIRSLKHMKSIVDETLLSEAHSLLPNFRTAEIREASEDASEIERTTRKWLTIMTKDCNRFCKILTLAGKRAISQIEVPKNRRKIIFADEAGGKLCHVKVFNDGQAFLSDCQ